MHVMMWWWVCACTAAGVSKCGTTDLYHKLLALPTVVPAANKARLRSLPLPGMAGRPGVCTAGSCSLTQPAAMAVALPMLHSCSGACTQR